jgi:hypothetical protein
LASPKELIKRAKAQFLKESRQMTRELATDKGHIVIGATGLGVWIDKPETF